MRLTPLDIRKQEFSHKMRGYDVDEVSAFLQMLANQWEELQDENRRHEEKIRELGGKLRHYEKVEEALQEALQTARESSRAVLQNAEEKASLMIARAEARADEITQQAERERHDLKRETATLSGRRSEIVTRLRAFLMSEMEMLARYEGDDPVGFIRLLPTEEGTTRRHSDRSSEQHVAEGRSSGGGAAPDRRDASEQSAAGEAAGEKAVRPARGTPPRETPPQGAPSQDAASQPTPPRESVASPPRPAEAQQPRPPEAQQPQPPESQPATTSDRPGDEEAKPDIPPATESPSTLHEAAEGGSHESRDPRYAAPTPAVDRERDEQGVVEGPGWTARTVVSRPSEQRSAPPDATRHGEQGEDADESEDDGEAQSGASSEEIEKIRRILSGLD